MSRISWMLNAAENGKRGVWVYIILTKRMQSNLKEVVPCSLCVIEFMRS